MISKNLSLYQISKILAFFVATLGFFFIATMQAQAAQVLTAKLTNPSGDVIEVDQYMLVNTPKVLVMNASMGDAGTTSIAAMDFEWLDTAGKLRKCNSIGPITAQGIVQGPAAMNTGDGWANACAKNIIDANEINAQITFIPNAEGTYFLQVKATDSKGVVVTSKRVELIVLPEGSVIPDTDRDLLVTRINQLTQVLLDLQEKLEVIKATDKGIFTNVVNLGFENDSIKLLQKVLATDPLIYPEGLVTGYFGVMTENALKNFQLKWGLEVTGLFSAQARFVLTEALSKHPFDQTAAPYLKNPVVDAAIKQALVDYKIVNLVVDGKVSFSLNPNFAMGKKNADIATLQRILATDPAIYPEAKISGSFDLSTSQAVGRFQEKYGLPKIGAVDAATLDTLKTILSINNSSVLANDLLLKPAVQPEVMTKFSDKDIYTIVAVREFLTENVLVAVNYGSFVDNFLLYPAGSPLGTTAEKADVVRDLATKLNKKEADISDKLLFEIQEKPDFPVRAMIWVALDDTISFLFTAKNAKNSQTFTVPKDIDWNESVEFNDKKIILGDLRNYIIKEARLENPVDPEITAVIKIAVADWYGVDVKAVPAFPIVYGAEEFVDNSGGG